MAAHAQTASQAPRTISVHSPQLVAIAESIAENISTPTCAMAASRSSFLLDAVASLQHSKRVGAETKEH